MSNVNESITDSTHGGRALAFFRSVFVEPSKIKDPVALLHEYFQSKGVKNPSATFHEVASAEVKGPSFYRYICQSPVSENSSSKSAASSLPATLLIETSCTEQNELEQLAKTYFDEYKVIDGKVFFKTKKAAKRSCALSMLLKLGYYCEVDHYVLAATIHEAQTILSRNNKVTSTEDYFEDFNSFENDVKTVQPLKFGKKSKMDFPRWVNRLYALGLDQVSILYHEEVNAVQDWNFQPIQLCCHLSCTYSSTSLSVTSLPCSSKELALECAVDKLEKLILTVAEAEDSVFHNKRTLEQDMKDESFAVQQKIKANLWHCDSQVAQYAECQSSWAASHFTFSSPSNTHTCYLYELIIRTEKLSSSSSPETLLVAEKLNINSAVTTRMGILFPQSIEPFVGWTRDSRIDSIYQTKFSYNDPTHGTRSAFVVLRHRTIIEDLTSVELAKVMQFNRGILSWKLYGMCKGGRSKDFHENILPETFVSGSQRTYLFVPLKTTFFTSTVVSIDWNLITTQLIDQPTPYYGVDENCLIPASWSLDAIDTFFICCSYISAVIISRSIIFLVHDCRSLSFSNILDCMAFFEPYVVVMLTFLALASLAFHFIPPRRNMPELVLQNRFVIHRGLMYVVAGQQRSRINAESSFPVSQTYANDRMTISKQNYGLDFLKANFVDYYTKKYGIRIRFPKECLLAANLVEKNDHNSYNPFVTDVKPKLQVHLLPELIQVLPMPRDFLYLVSFAQHYMPFLERKIDVTFKACILLKTGPILAPVNTGVYQQHLERLTHLLSEATQIYPKPLYKRLEFLGDAVLGFILAINLILQNNGVEWDETDLCVIHSALAKNTTLSCAAQRAGIVHLLQFKNVVWRSMYNVGAVAKLERGCVSDSVLSDTVESILAAIYLSGKCDLSAASAALKLFLDTLELPLCAPVYDTETTAFKLEFIRHAEFDPDPFFNSSISFNLYLHWKVKLAESIKIIHSWSSLRDRLSVGLHTLFARLASISGLKLSYQMMSGQSLALIYCALFDNDLTDPLKFTEEVVDPTLFEPLAIIRDNLYHLGAHALKLLLSEEVYRRFPCAGQDDLHLLRNVTITDDVIAYVTMKNGLQNALFDVEPYKFEDILLCSDKIGQTVWESCEGWILPGGIKTYQQRLTSMSMFNIDSKLRIPQYPGLAGGRLHGFRSKLCETITNDLMFSFKAIVGSLLLSFGLENMWSSVGPLFDELLLLTHDELREHFGNQSTLVQSAGPSKNNHNPI